MKKSPSEVVNQSDQDMARLVSDYLRSHPEFFAQNGDLLTDLTVPHASGKAISLIERQVQVFQDRYRQLHAKYQEFVVNARDNESLSQQLHLLTERLLQAPSVDAVLNVLRQSLFDDFKVEHVSLRIFIDSGRLATAETFEFVTLEAPARRLFGPVLDDGRPMCGRLDEQQKKFFFRSHPEDIASACLVPLRGRAWQGLMTLASSDERRYYAGMGVDLMAHLGDLASLALNGHLCPSE